MDQEYKGRLDDPRMDYYKGVYKDSPAWDGKESLENKTVLCYCEQGYGDIIQFVRYIPLLQRRCGKVILHCPKTLHHLFACLGAELIDKEERTLPPHDVHVLSMSLPFLLGVWDLPTPYLAVIQTEQLPQKFASKVKIGIAWEGSPDNPYNERRNCPLRHFLSLDTEKTALFMLQDQIRDQKLLSGATDLVLQGVPINDFYDTAKLINAMDYVVSVDTAVLHLAGALGKFTFGLLAHDCDPRWSVDPWYHRFVLIRQKTAGDWDAVFNSLISILKTRGILS